MSHTVGDFMLDIYGANSRFARLELDGPHGKKQTHLTVMQARDLVYALERWLAIHEAEEAAYQRGKP